MKPKNKIQKDDITLPGGLGEVKIGSASHEIVKMFKSNDGSTTLTINPLPSKLHLTIDENSDFWKQFSQQQIEPPLLP